MYVSTIFCPFDNFFLFGAVHLTIDHYQPSDKSVHAENKVLSLVSTIGLISRSSS
jgi:hypothetical protein